MKLKAVIVGAAMALLLIGMSGATAMAEPSAPVEPVPVDVLPDPTPESVAALQQSLEGQGYVPTVSTDGGVLTKEYDVTQAGSPRVVIETTEPAPLDPGQIAPRLHVGVGNGVYIYLNRADQTALAAGSATSMGIIICGLPGINVVACGGVAGALVAAASYVASYGICPNEMEVHFGGFLNPGPNIKCL